jgi:hypothetical protein
MNYSVGSLVRVRVYSGHFVDANITAIKSRSAGRKIHIVYGNVTAAINPAQIIEVQMLPKTGTKEQIGSRHHKFCAKSPRTIAT